MEKLAILGGSYDPVHRVHVSAARLSIEHYGKAVVIPCGPRKDKATVARINPVHRAAMLQLAFAGIAGVKFDFSDLEKNYYTVTWELEQRFRAQGVCPVHVFGSDLLYGDGGIRAWDFGEQLWRQGSFLILPRSGYLIDRNDLPPHCQIAQEEFDGASTRARDLIYLSHDPKAREETLQELVPESVAEYIRLHNLYTGMMDQSVVSYSKYEPKVFAVGDSFRPETLEVAAKLGNTSSPADADVIAVCAGDGKLLEVINEFWQFRKPFFGVNYGTVGFLMNDVKDRLLDPNLFMNLELANCPMLHVTAEFDDGSTEETLAFNDAWVEADRGVSTEFDVLLNGEREFRFLGFIGLVATPAGSTGYFFNISKTAFPVGIPMLGVTTGLGMPAYWPGTQVQDNAVIEFVNTNPRRRKMFAFTDGRPTNGFKPVVSLKIRKSRVAGARILKVENDFQRKLATKQFPR